MQQGRPGLRERRRRDEELLELQGHRSQPEPLDLPPQLVPRLVSEAPGDVELQAGPVRVLELQLRARAGGSALLPAPRKVQPVEARLQGCDVLREEHAVSQTQFLRRTRTFLVEQQGERVLLLRGELGASLDSELSELRQPHCCLENLFVVLAREFRPRKVQPLEELELFQEWDQLLLVEVLVSLQAQEPDSSQRLVKLGEPFTSPVVLNRRDQVQRLLFLLHQPQQAVFELPIHLYHPGSEHVVFLHQASMIENRLS